MEVQDAQAGMWEGNIHLVPGASMWPGPCSSRIAAY